MGSYRPMRRTRRRRPNIECSAKAGFSHKSQIPSSPLKTNQHPTLFAPAPQTPMLLSCRICRNTPPPHLLLSPLMVEPEARALATLCSGAAQKFKVSRVTIYHWIKNHRDFSAALQQARELRRLLSHDGQLLGSRTGRSAQYPGDPRPADLDVFAERGRARFIRSGLVRPEPNYEYAV
jgi:hypothetical protein